MTLRANDQAHEQYHLLLKTVPLIRAHWRHGDLLDLSRDHRELACWVRVWVAVYVRMR